MIVTPSTKEKEIKEMKFPFYPCGFLFVTNKITSRILVLFEFMQPPIPEIPNIDFPTTYNSLHNATEPNFM